MLLPRMKGCLWGLRAWRARVAIARLDLSVLLDADNERSSLILGTVSYGYVYSFSSCQSQTHGRPRFLKGGGAIIKW